MVAVEFVKFRYYRNLMGQVYCRASKKSPILVYPFEFRKYKNNQMEK